MGVGPSRNLREPRGLVWPCAGTPPHGAIYGFKAPEARETQCPGRGHGLPGCHFIQGQVPVIDLKR